MTRGAGFGNGMLGVLIFSGSLPATRLAEQCFPPLFLTAIRGVVAGLIGLFLLLSLRQRRPDRSDLAALLMVAGGVVIGFPLLTALALPSVGTAHSVIWTAMLPLSTAIFGMLRGGERPSQLFWLFSLSGAAIVAGFVLAMGHGGWRAGDGLMLLAVLVCGLAYAEGAKLSRRLGGWQVISWALAIALPATGALMLAVWPARLAPVSASALFGLGYVTLFSMLVGFVFWYRGLAIGGTARVGQLQLLQPLGGLALCGLLLREPVPPGLIVVAVAVLLCVAGARRFA